MPFTCQVVYLAVCVGHFKNRQEKSEPTVAHLLCQHDVSIYCRPKPELWDLGTDLE